MQLDFEMYIKSINSIYGEKRNQYDRDLKLYFSIPKKGVNEDTGLFTYIYGFGGNASGNMCRKMRRMFADKYNLVTIQCDYFGYEFMKNEYSLDIRNIDLLSDYEKDIINKDFSKFISRINREFKLEGNAKMDENVENFNDMGIMQALDIVISNLTVMNILYSNNFLFNPRKNILYGSSHGGYIANLANLITKDLFTLLVDNSGWHKPLYLSTQRIASKRINNVTIYTYFNYLAKKYSENIFTFDIKENYRSYGNNCNVKMYHGINDKISDVYEKKDVTINIENMKFNIIDDKEVDGEIFKSTNHCMDSDYFKLFEKVIKDVVFEKNKDYKLPDEVFIKSNLGELKIDYKNIMPKVYMK